VGPTVVRRGREVASRGRRPYRWRWTGHVHSRILEVAVGVVAGFGGEGDEVGAEGGPGGFGGQAGDVLVDVVEVGDGLAADGLLGGVVEAVGVALDGIEQPGRWVLELAQHGAGGDGRFIAAEDLLQRLGRGEPPRV